MATAVAPPKPRLRGWLHLCTTPLALIGGLVLTAKGTTYANRVAIAVAILPHTQTVVLLSIVWVAASAIVISSVVGYLVHLTAPRWLYTAMYIALGWAAVFWLPDLLHYGGVVNFLLIVAGGVLYTAGGVVYALRRPVLAPRTFGFHELFHACTVAAFLCHFVVVARVAC